MANIDPAVFTNLRDEIKALKRAVDKQNALVFISLKHELEKEQAAGIDNTNYLNALNYVTEFHIDLVLSNVAKKLVK